MCSIFGRSSLGSSTVTVHRRLAELARIRGRDSWGVSTYSGYDLRVPDGDIHVFPPEGISSARWIIGNCRAEPTTEYVPDKDSSAVQPFALGELVVAHNGTIANDEALVAGLPRNTGLEAPGAKIDTYRWAQALSARTAGRRAAPEDVLALLGETVGSYGIAVGSRAAVEDGGGWLVLATNYKPIWTRIVDEPSGSALEFTSVAPRSYELDYFTRLREGWEMLDPYSALVFEGGNVTHIDLRSHEAFAASYAKPFWASIPSTVTLAEGPQAGETITIADEDRLAPFDDSPERALVVCSGGLDSVTAASLAADAGLAVDLLHVTYGARAEAREIEAVTAVAARMQWGLRFLDLSGIFAEIGHSRLTGTWEGVADGVSGAEYAHEWVPARNTILLAVATGLAEAHGYDYLVLGNNIEESGAYPDNEQEFVGRFNDLLPFAVGDGKRVRILEPVGAYTKREIVEFGLRVNAPLDLTWSCYDGGELHCGECGPCYMRRVAFQMAGVSDPISYLSDRTE